MNAPLPERTIRRHLRDLRRLLERIDTYAAPADSTEQRHLTQAIHGLSRAAQALSARYHGRSPFDAMQSEVSSTHVDE